MHSAATRRFDLPKTNAVFGNAFAARRRAEAVQMVRIVRATGFLSSANANTRVGRRVLAVLAK